MITPTHVVINGALARLAGGERDGLVASGLRRLLDDAASRRAFVIGGLAPDVGLILMSLGASVWFPAVEGFTRAETFDHVYGTLFYEDRAWLAVHNVFHAPLVLVPLLGLGLRLGGRRGRIVAGLVAGCLLHAVIDVATHVTDGPLILFPIDWETRVQSVVSYWDPRHGGRILGPIDQTITVIGGGWLLTRLWVERRMGRDAGVSAAGGARDDDQR